MIAACPTCGARYRIDTGKLRPDGARLRCSRCESVFRVRAPAGAAPPAPAPEPAPRAAPRREESAPADAPPAGAPVSREVDRERLVLVAHPEPEQGKAIADALCDWGLSTILVHDGVEAILNIQRSLPRTVILDAALPKMFGFQVCELMKRNESLRQIQVVLVGAIHDQGRYRRPPGELYGADAYIERQQLPDGLVPIFERFAIAIRTPRSSAPEPAARVRPSAPAPEPAAPVHPPAPEPAAPVHPPVPEPAAPVRPPPTVPAAQVAPPAAQAAPPAAQAAPPAAQVAPPAPAMQAPPAGAAAQSAPQAAAGADPALAAEIEQAGRLARIIVSDIVLYNPEKFEAGLRAGNVVEALSAELAEGHALFAQRVDPRVGDPDEFLQRELIRVARTRGMAS